MVTPVAAALVTLALVLWDRHLRHHPAWHLSINARFCAGSGYAMTVIAAYFLLGASGQAWAFGIVWACAALSMFITASVAMQRILHRQHAAALSIETIPHTEAQAPTSGC